MKQVLIKTLWAIVAIIAIIAIGLFGICQYQRLQNLRDEALIKEYSEEPQLNLEDPDLTISQVLQFRRDVTYEKYIDSIYLAMPETVLIAVLIKEGVNSSQRHIVEEYLNNQEYYDNIEFRKAIQEYYDSQQDTITSDIEYPDSTKGAVNTNLSFNVTPSYKILAGSTQKDQLKGYKRRCDKMNDVYSFYYVC